MPTPEPSTPPQQRGNSTRLSRDDRIRILALRDAGFTYQQIAHQLQITHRQVQYTCQSQQLTPKKAPGKPPKLSEEDVNDIIAFISSSKHNRRMPFYKVCQELDLPVGPSALARALKKRDYTRHIAL
jgi:ketohexokinase/beta-glucosidase